MAVLHRRQAPGRDIHEHFSLAPARGLYMYNCSAIIDVMFVKCVMVYEVRHGDVECSTESSDARCKFLVVKETVEHVPRRTQSKSKKHERTVHG